jgi:hypothetical protein
VPCIPITPRFFCLSGTKRGDTMMKRSYLLALALSQYFFALTAALAH